MENKRNGLRVSVAALLILAMIMSLAASPVFAAAPSKERVKYLGSGRVEVDFYGDVDYRGTKVTVRDTSGKKYSAYLYDRDDDDLKFRIKKYKTGKTYKFTISGVRREGTRSYGQVTGKVKISKASSKIKIKDVDYLGSGRVDVEFRRDVAFKKVKVSVKDTSGKKYKASVYRRGDDDLKFKVANYKTGKTYKFTVSGVRERGTSKYRSASGTFKIKKAAKTITMSQAKAIAFKDAGVSASQVYDLSLDKDYDDGRVIYEVSFKANGYEYDYEISTTGKILKRDIDRDDDYWDEEDDD